MMTEAQRFEERRMLADHQRQSSADGLRAIGDRMIAATKEFVSRSLAPRDARIKELELKMAEHKHAAEHRTDRQAAHIARLELASRS
jgi:hypothetical protein